MVQLSKFALGQKAHLFSLVNNKGRQINQYNFKEIVSVKLNNVFQNFAWCLWKVTLTDIHSEYVKMVWFHFLGRCKDGRVLITYLRDEDILWVWFLGRCLYGFVDMLAQFGYDLKLYQMLLIFLCLQSNKSWGRFIRFICFTCPLVQTIFVIGSLLEALRAISKALNGLLMIKSPICSFYRLTKETHYLVLISALRNDNF